ncbi:HNH endonuclease family protein [Dietzia cercidiphylli]|uniref:HNH endonuclease family protein n=1 Tax=Dietzia cercidiphylli TaxID=498199 RepID=UPI00223B1CBC|nr:HNH endonuclease family protein [Dietzia cercidiphylli]MCT1515304.1 HNH endonuclease family protein [Dietzia cercidiphylli]
MTNSSRTIAGLAAAVIALGSVGYRFADVEPQDSGAAAQPAPTAPASLAGATKVQGLLGQVRIIPEVQVPGYDRDCSPGDGCVFGPAWSDDVTVPGGHNGCDTRNDVLAGQLEGVSYKPGTRNCVVSAGELRDPYTGQSERFMRGEGSTIHIDHVVPLARAWNFGAATWSEDQRRNFANDPANLRATSASVNQTKSDKGPAEWMPAHDPCGYAGAYLTVATTYQLAITAADRDVLAGACPVK